MGKLENLINRGIQPTAVVYVRYSSNGQREESIDAQLRGIRNYAKQNDIILVGEYCDRAKSATTDNRPEFLRMIEDSKAKKFNLVIVHKIDRFARNIADSMHYKKELKKSGVELLSAMEGINDTSPGSLFNESILDAMSEYYSKNLSLEVMKGMTENALKCMHTGGIPPLGFDVNPGTKKYEINQEESKAIQLIFQSVIEGRGYSQIIHQLNTMGAKTKRGGFFGKNSIYEILRNEKYRGVYIFNRSASSDPDHKRNNHLSKDDCDIIRIENGVPRIIEDEDFFKVQEILKHRKHTSLHGKAKEVYLLSGKIYCGECGSVYCGNRKMSGRNKRLHVTYRCNNRTSRTSTVCSNKEINRDYIEHFVLESVSEVIFDDRLLPSLIRDYNAYVAEQSTDVQNQILSMEKHIRKLTKQIDNVVDAIASLNSPALAAKLTELEKEKSDVIFRLECEKRNSQQIIVPEEVIKDTFYGAKALFRSKELSETRELINLFVERVTVYAQHIDIEINVLRPLTLAAVQGDYRMLQNIRQDALLKKNRINREDVNSAIRKK